MTNHQNLQNPAEGSFDGFVGRSDGTRAHSHPAASETPTDTAPRVRATRWLIHFLDREPLEVWFAPAADHDEALVAYHDAVAAEPLPAMSELAREYEQESARECARQSAHETARKSFPKNACESIQKTAQQSAQEPAQQSAQQSAATGCKSCRHLLRPGRSSAYCSGRDDLPGAYGDHHPLRKLPADQGESCACYTPFED